MATASEAIQQLHVLRLAERHHRVKLKRAPRALARYSRSRLSERSVRLLAAGIGFAMLRLQAHLLRVASERKSRSARAAAHRYQHSPLQDVKDLLAAATSSPNRRQSPSPSRAALLAAASRWSRIPSGNHDHGGREDGGAAHGLVQVAAHLHLTHDSTTSPAAAEEEQLDAVRAEPQLQVASIHSAGLSEEDAAVVRTMREAQRFLHACCAASHAHSLLSARQHTAPAESYSKLRCHAEEPSGVPLGLAVRPTRLVRAQASLPGPASSAPFRAMASAPQGVPQHDSPANSSSDDEYQSHDTTREFGRVASCMHHWRRACMSSWRIRLAISHWLDRCNSGDSLRRPWARWRELAAAQARRQAVNILQSVCAHGLRHAFGGWRSSFATRVFDRPLNNHGTRGWPPPPRFLCEALRTWRRTPVDARTRGPPCPSQLREIRAEIRELLMVA